MERSNNVLVVLMISLISFSSFSNDVNSEIKRKQENTINSWRVAQIALLTASIIGGAIYKCFDFMPNNHGTEAFDEHQKNEESTIPVKELPVHPSPFVVQDGGHGCHVVVNMVPSQVSQKNQLKILLVDDSRAVVLVPRRILEQNGHSVVWVESGNQAIDELTRRDYDLVLMDHNMPELDGLQTVEIIRNRGIDVPIVSHSSDDLQGDLREQYASLGVYEFCNKSRPTRITYQNLISKVLGN